MFENQTIDPMKGTIMNKIIIFNITIWLLKKK